MPIATVIMLVHAIPAILTAGKSIADIIKSIAETHDTSQQQNGRAPTEDEWQAMLEKVRNG